MTEIDKSVNLIQALLYASFGGFSVKEILEVQKN